MRVASSIVALTLISLVAASPYSVSPSGAGNGGQSIPIGGSQSHTHNGLSAPSSVPSGGPVHGHRQSYTVSGTPLPSGFSGHPTNNGTGTGTSGSPGGARPSSGASKHGVHGSGSTGYPAQTAGSPTTPMTTATTTSVPESAPTHA